MQERDSRRIRGTERVSDQKIFIDRIVLATTHPKRRRAGLSHVVVRGAVRPLSGGSDSRLYRFTADFDDLIGGKTKSVVEYSLEYLHSHDDGPHDEEESMAQRLGAIGDSVREKAPYLSVELSFDKLYIQSVASRISGDNIGGKDRL